MLLPGRGDPRDTGAAVSRPYVDFVATLADAVEQAATAAANLWAQHRIQRGDPTEDELRQLAERFDNEFWIACDTHHIRWPDQEVHDERSVD